ncbi:Autophagy-related protein [Teratosphaeria destructans]|uniref:Autophagy-related protein n=1 Tax=Teratosphaeria destructans TaxID=418781 RepID=A0A9W7SYV9_9PEZI|nr:Autophagy-related protein [Teratosphaeria destructans]
MLDFRRSWFSRASASTQRLLSESHLELPRWRTPSPMRASMIPPPIVQSVYAGHPADREVTRSLIIEPTTPLHEQERDLHADLQFLLDAQSEGLQRGQDGGADDHSSTGSTTPTARSSSRRATRPARKKPGLKTARKGIYNSIRALSAVKSEELQAIEAEAADKDATLAQIDEWERRRAGLQKAQRRVDDGEETVRAQRLRQEADTLQEDINHVEMQLADMKARHSKLSKQIAAVENSVQAKLASYTASLEMLEKDVQRFLSLEDDRHAPKHPEQSLRALPPQRRTLDLARQEWTELRDEIVQQRQDIEHEKQALDEGAVMWKEVVMRITDFEKKLQADMAGMKDMSHSQSAWEDPPSPPQHEDRDERLKELLGQLNDLSLFVETQLAVAEQKKWTLLIAAIGAEVEALQKGKRVLSSLLPTSSDSVDGREHLVETDGGDVKGDAGHDGDEGDEIHELEKSFMTTRPAPPSVVHEDSDEEIEPQLLFSRS